MKTRHKTKLYAIYFSASLLLFALLTLILTSFTQAEKANSSPLKKVTKVYLESISYGVSEDVDISSIPDDKLAELRPFSQRVTDEFIIDDSYYSSRTREYDRPADNPDAWIKPYYKAVTNISGTYLYDKNGVLMHHMEPASNVLESKDFSNVDLAAVGYYPLFRMLDNAQISALYQSGFSVSILNQNQYLYYNENTEVRVDIAEQSLDHRTFENQDLVHRTFRDFETVAGGLNIPSVFIEEDYTGMGHGLFKASNRKDFLFYSIDGRTLKSTVQAKELLPTEYTEHKLIKDRKAISRFRADRHTVQLEVKPNPAAEKIQIKARYSDDEQASLSIISIQGNLIKMFTPGEGETNITADISDLDPGLYIIQLQTREERHTTTFIKK